MATELRSEFSSSHPLILSPVLLFIVKKKKVNRESRSNMLSKKHFYRNVGRSSSESSIIFLLLARNRYYRPRIFLFRTCSCGPRRRSWMRSEEGRFGGWVVVWKKVEVERTSTEKNECLTSHSDSTFSSLFLSFFVRSGNKRKRINLKSISQGASASSGKSKFSSPRE